MSRSRVAIRLAAFGALTLSLVLGACGGEEGPPDAEFDPAGLAADIEALDDAYESDAAESYNAAIAAIDGSVTSSLMGTSFRLLRSLPRDAKMGPLVRASAQVTREMKELFTHASAPRAMSIVVPEELRATTFVYNVDTDQYEVSQRTGAPANGMRFMLYAINPATGGIAEPLNEIGYIDAIDLSSATTDAVSFLVVAGTTTYFAYDVEFSGTESSGRVDVNGFVSNGTTHVNHDITLAADEGGTGELHAEFNLDVPARGFSLQYSLEATDVNTATPRVAYDLIAEGRNGRMGLVGSGTDAEETATFTVNGEPFANFTHDNGTTTITRPDGSQLTDEEAQAVTLVYATVFYGFTLFLILVAPLSSVLPGPVLD